MPSLNEGLELISQVRRDNPALSDLNDQELADLVMRQSPDPRIKPVAQSSALSRGIAHTGKFFSGLGEETRTALASPDSSFPRRVVARAAGNLVSGAPELGVNLAAGALKGLPRLAGFGLGAGLTYERTKAETGDNTAALGSAAGALLGLAGAIKGSQVGRSLVGESAKPITKILAGTAGATAGQFPGDVLATAMAPGGIAAFLNEPENLPAYLVGQTVVGAGMDFAAHSAENRQTRIQTTKASAPDFSDLVNKSDADQFAALRNKPAAELTEIDRAQMQDLEKRLSTVNEQLVQTQFRNVAKTKPDDLATLPEPPVTIKAQVHLLNQGKKPVVEIPSGTSLPDLPVYMQGFKEYSSESGHTYLYDDTKVTPDIIESSIKSNTLGTLLGYGTGSLPKNPTGKVAVLRSKRGTEKAAVVLGDQNEQSVFKALGDMALGDDTVSTETPQQVATWRLQNRGLEKLFSLSSEMSNPDSEISFTNHILSMFDKATKPTDKRGPRFQVDQNAEISTKGLVAAVKQWAPKEMWDHYVDRGILTLLEPNKVDVPLYTIFGPEYGKRAVQIDLIKNEGRGNPLTEQERSALPQPPEDLPTGQYVKSGDKWVPIAKNTDYETLVKQTTPKAKIKAAKFTKWIRENTPEVEVKKLVPAEATDTAKRLAELQHQVEILGGSVEGSIVHDSTGRPVAPNARHQLDEAQAQFRPLAQEILQLRSKAFNELETDAATGRYGVEPKDLSQMPGAVDILVRVPSSNPTAEWTPKILTPAESYQVDSQSDELFRGPHFGGSDVNVLASVRGYEETLPTGEKVFHVFELQSDWGQRLAKSREAAQPHPVSGNVNEQAANFLRDKNHPLLAHYETLALKTAIQHAREIGAKFIAISDAETAMMTEGHDRNQQFAPEDPDSRSNIGKIPQETGMRAAYDERLPAIARKLTGDKGSRVEFGTHRFASEFREGSLNRQVGEAPEGSPVFKNGQGKPKTEITARLFNIENPSPEVFKLFSLYDADAQTSFETTLAKENSKFETGERTTEELTPEQLLERSINGENVTVDSLLNFLSGIKGVRGTLREGTFLNPAKFASFDIPTKTIIFNKEVGTSIRQRFTKLSHELTHGAVEDFRHESPQAYEYYSELVDKLGIEGRKSILNEVKEKVKLGPEFDTSYLSGELFDKNDPVILDKQVHEFTAGLVEAAAEHYFQAETMPEWFRYLPQPVSSILSKLVKTFRKYFGESFPSITALLDHKQGEKLSSIVKVMEKHIVDLQQANVSAALKLRKTSVFDESTLRQELPSLRGDIAQGVLGTRGGNNELYSFARSLYDNTLGKVAKPYEKFLFSALFRTRTEPWTADHFWNLHNLRPNIQSEDFGYHSNLGQVPEGTLSRQQALERWGKFMNKTLLDPKSQAGNRFKENFSKIAEENQNRRQKLSANGESISWDKLVTKEQMQKDFHLSAEEAEYADRILHMPELVAAEEHRKAELVDTHQFTKLFYRANKEQDINGVISKVQRLNRVVNQFGDKRFELDVYKRRLALENRQANPDLELQGILGENVNRLESEQSAFKVILEQGIKQEFLGSIPFTEGRDPFIASVGEAMVRQAALRAHHKYITKDAGYAPMTRRGRFLLRVYDTSELGEEFAKVKEFKGFDSKKEALKYIENNKILPADYELMDKEDLRQRVQMFTPDRLKLVRDRAKEQLGELVQQIADRTVDMEPSQRESILETLHDLELAYSPLEDEIKEVLSVRGDKFKERRYLVPGFDRNDFLPNIFEYMNYKTVAGNKKLARSFGELQMERKELDDNPEMRQRMEQELNYTLSNQTEFNALKKTVFYYYLGASFRHVVQNAVQIPLNGISQMVADGHGLSSYKHFGRAGKLAAQYGFTGTTGDRVIDSMLKQAEKEGVSFQTSLEAPVHESIELQNALDSINAQNSGTKLFGAKVNYSATQLIKGFEKFMMSTSAAAEAANRKTTFIASILAERSRGLKDPQQLYNKASQFTNYVNFVGDKPNRPGYLILEGGKPMHGPLSVMSVLQSFTINYISQLYSFWKKGFIQGSKADKQAFATGIAHLLAFSGSLGLIGASTAEELLEQTTGINLKKSIRSGLVQAIPGHEEAMDRVADTVLGGLPSLLGMDASNSIGLGSPFFRYQAGQSLSLEQFGGAALGMLGRVAQGVGEIKADPFNPQQWWQATRSSAPAFLSNAIRVYDVLNSGTMLDAKQQPVSDPLGIEGSVSTLLGFTPTQVSKQREFNSEIYKNNKKSADEYQRNVLNISKSLVDYQNTGNTDQLLTANKMFGDYLTSVDYMQDRGSMVDSITEQLQQFEGRVTQPATQKSSAFRQELEASFPTVASRYPSELSTVLQEIEVAQLLGQDDLLLKKLKTLPSEVQAAMLKDLLASTGLRPEQSSLIRSPASAARLGRSPAQPALQALSK